MIQLIKKIIARKACNCIIFGRSFDYRRLNYSSDKDKNGFNSGNCPFCKPDLIVKDYGKVLLIKNKFPYEHTQDHLLVIPKRHIRTWKELNLEELQQIQEVISEYLDKGYLLLGRQFVKYNFINYASVYHLHIHLILNKF